MTSELFSSVTSLEHVFAKHDDEYPYKLPYSWHRMIKVIQGYGGLFSHFGSSYYSIDFGLPRNAEILATRPGTVITVVDKYPAGGLDQKFNLMANYVEILHDDRSVGKYAHIARSSSPLKEGDKVESGELIGLCGNSGWCAGFHLHFHVEMNGSRIPTKFEIERGNCQFLIEGSFYRGV